MGRRFRRAHRKLAPLGLRLRDTSPRVGVRRAGVPVLGVVRPRWFCRLGAGRGCGRGSAPRSMPEIRVTPLGE